MDQRQRRSLLLTLFSRNTVFLSKTVFFYSFRCFNLRFIQIFSQIAFFLNIGYSVRFACHIGVHSGLMTFYNLENGYFSTNLRLRQCAGKTMNFDFPVCFQFAFAFYPKPLSFDTTSSEHPSNGYFDSTILQNLSNRPPLCRFICDLSKMKSFRPIFGEKPGKNELEFCFKSSAVLTVSLQYYAVCLEINNFYARLACVPKKLATPLFS